MKKFLLIILSLMATVQLQAQRERIDSDIFGDLKYESGGYRAALQKNIFDDLTFSDNRNNKVVYEKKYLEQEYRNALGEGRAKTDFFRSLVRRFSSRNGYQAKYSVDIFGTVIIEDNRGNRIERGTDIFGNPTYKEQSDGRDMSMRRSLNGTLEYKAGRSSASLGRDIFDKWIYRDSSGNKFEFGPEAWNRLSRRFDSDEDVFYFLIREFLAD